ncbi:glutamyl-tRNA reductase [Desulfohalobiaceae bacterium Ax17]|uniref:glutamyl-tRNA reductase n=1 Tax=Desulfovulcanus ferrireducens TaxID=2831190 RepID=UPI00207B98A7|nr:glutamyl-tRNA reductase [Desulfovulcanus ferrireducens]MBT8764067.1 glutamyl-tRNA reductase [Desulfovulcanus ferrireducens]
MQKIYLFGLNHRTASVEVREKFALTNFNPLKEGLISQDGPITEALVLSTCNRVEILCVGSAAQEDVENKVLNTWAGFCAADINLLKKNMYFYQDLGAVEHLFTVASSLDSMVLGEPQILGQLKDAYRKAVKEQTVKVIINRLLHKSFSVAKRVCTETAVAANAVSISYAAVELAKRIFGDLSKHRAMLVGAGEMAELAAIHLLNSGVQEILVVNRTLERAQELACKFQGKAACLDDLQDNLLTVDIVISSTGAPSTIIQARDLKKILKKRKHRPIFFIDIAVPRDIDPDVNLLDNVYLYDIDDLKEVVEENLANRKAEAEKARMIIKQEVDKFAQWLKSLDLNPTIVDLLAKGETIAQRELKRTLRGLKQDVDEKTYLAMETLAQSLVKKLYHEPIMFLKRRTREEENAQKFIDLTRRMFNLDNEHIPENAHKDRKR